MKKSLKNLSKYKLYFNILFYSTSFGLTVFKVSQFNYGFGIFIGGFGLGLISSLFTDSVRTLIWKSKDKKLKRKSL